MKKFGVWLKENILALAVPVILLAVWETASRLGWVRVTLLPPPSAIFTVLVDLLKSGEIFTNLGVSILRVAQGFLIGATLGVIVGVQMALVKKIRIAVSLIFGLLRPIPVIAWIPVLILWMGIDEGSKITVISIGSFWTVLVNVVEGIRNVDKKYLEVATILEKKRTTLLTKVVIPAALPAIFTGVRVGIDVAWRSVVAAELIAASSGIGYMIMYARELSQIDVVLIGVLSIGVTGILIEQLLKLLEKRLLRWNVNLHES
jgi:sulfonate transport system permease protein